MSHLTAMKPLKSIRTALTAGAVATAGLVLSGCQNAFDGLNDRHNVPLPETLKRTIKAKGMTVASPIMLRILKQEDELEVWKQTHTGRYALLKKYDICKWSGKFGPKFKEGDRQAPEGFYFVNKHQMNPRSSYHLSFNMGFPNKYDRAHGRTGSHLMVHGACSSAGCYSMTDEYIEEIYALAREALASGQKNFQIQAFPFRMTPENMVKHRGSKHYPFWQMIKQGYDHFQITKVPPKVDICDRRYVFNTIGKGNYTANASCPQMEMPQTLANSFVKRQQSYALDFEKLLAKAEGRSAAALAPLTFETALPGVSVVGAKPTAAERREAEAEPGGAANNENTSVTTGSVKDSLSGDG